MVGECVDARHPVLVGRVLVRFVDRAGGATEQWVPTLQGLVVREGDRVLVLSTSNSPEPIAIGVVDGWRRREEPPRKCVHAVELKGDEAVHVVTDSGVPILEVVRRESGPVLRLLHADAQVELPGKLRIRAHDIELVAERGGVRIDASDDVVVRAEMIHLN